MNQLLRQLLGLRRDFDYIFFRNEFQALAGRAWRTIATLSLILFLTLLALGFAVGSIENLRVKMDNPFTNWIDLPINNDIAAKVTKVQQRYAVAENKTRFQLESMVSFGRRALNFYTRDYDLGRHRPDTLLRTAFGRTIEVDEAIFERILDQQTGNVLWIDEAFQSVSAPSFSGCEIIISQSLLKKLGYERPEAIQHVLLQDDERYFLKVVAVLRELPGKNDYIISPILYNVLEASANCRQQLLVKNEVGKNSFVFAMNDATSLADLRQVARTFFAGQSPEIEPFAELATGSQQYQLNRIYFSPSNTPSLDSVRLFLTTYRPEYALSEVAHLDCGGNLCRSVDERTLHYLAFHFGRLDRIRDFKNDMLHEFQIELDMNKVEAKENFALVGRLTLSTALMLLVFSILSIVLFVNNLLQTHLNKVRPNLGTFQAFGLSNAFLVGAYLKIIFCFLLIATSLAFALSVLLDRGEQCLLGDDSRFNIFSPYILAAVLGVLLLSVLLASRTIRRILHDTPGNLIYGR